MASSGWPGFPEADDTQSPFFEEVERERGGFGGAEEPGGAATAWFNYPPGRASSPSITAVGSPSRWGSGQLPFNGGSAGPASGVGSGMPEETDWEDYEPRLPETEEDRGFPPAAARGRRAALLSAADQPGALPPGALSDQVVRARETEREEEADRAREADAAMAAQRACSTAFEGAAPGPLPRAPSVAFAEGTAAAEEMLGGVRRSTPPPPPPPRSSLDVSHWQMGGSTGGGGGSGIGGYHGEGVFHDAPPRQPAAVPAVTDMHAQQVNAATAAAAAALAQLQAVQAQLQAAAHPLGAADPHAGQGFSMPPPQQQQQHHHPHAYAAVPPPPHHSSNGNLYAAGGQYAAMGAPYDAPPEESATGGGWAASPPGSLGGAAGTLPKRQLSRGTLQQPEAAAPPAPGSAYPPYDAPPPGFMHRRPSQVILAEGYQAAAQPGDSYPQYAAPADGAYADSAPSHRPPPRPPSGYAPVSTSPRSGGGGGFGSPASTTGDTAVGDAQTEKLKREVARLQGEVERLDKEVARQKSLREGERSEFTDAKERVKASWAADREDFARVKESLKKKNAEHHLQCGRLSQAVKEAEAVARGLRDLCARHGVLVPAALDGPGAPVPAPPVPKEAEPAANGGAALAEAAPAEAAAAQPDLAGQLATALSQLSMVLGSPRAAETAAATGGAGNGAAAVAAADADKVVSALTEGLAQLVASVSQASATEAKPVPE